MKIVKNLTKSNKTKLKDLCKVNLGQSPSSDSYSQIKTDTPFFQGAADFTDKYTFIRNYTNAPKKQAYENDLLMTVRAPAGRVNFANVNCAIGRGLCSFDFRDEKLKNYMYFYLNNLYRKNGWSMDVQGAIFEAINKDQIEEKDITIDFETYGKISSFLSIIENRLITYKNLLEKIEIRNQYYADKLLSGEISINEKNEIYENNEWKDLIVNGKNKKAMKSAKKVKLEDFKYQTSKGVSGKEGYLEIGDIDVKTKKYDITKKDKLSVNGCRACEKNILVISTVRPQRLGYTITKDHLFISNAFVTIDINKNKILEYIIKTDDFMKHISENSEGAIYPTIKESKLLNFEFFYDEQKEIQIFDFLKKLDVEKEKVEKLLKLEEQRFEWLSDKLLSGEYIIED